MNRVNSEMSRQGVFKFSISKKGAKYKPKRIQQSMSESIVTLTAVPNGLQCHIEKTREQFLLSKDNICGLETGRIVLPTRKCWGGGKHEYNNYLMVVLHDGHLAQMILLLTQQNGNTDEDQITTNWKWFIQNKLDFVNSWPNVAVDCDEPPHKMQSKQLTLMLGKTWLSIFKYYSESLPSFWKYFRISQISVDLVNVRLASGLETEACVIRVQGTNQAHGERLVIKSRRQGDIYGYIQTYISPPPTPPRRSDLPPIPPSSLIPSSVESSTHQSLSSSSSDTTEVKQIYSTSTGARTLPRSRNQLSQMVEVPDLKKMYIMSQRAGVYFTTQFPVVSVTPVAKTSRQHVTRCQLNLPPPLNLRTVSTSQEHIEPDLSPPSPCGSSRSPTSLKDFGYVDRPYLDMKKKSYGHTPSVALPDVSSPIDPSHEHYGGYPTAFTSGLNYIHILAPLVDHEATAPDQNLLTVRKPSFQRTLSFQPHLSVVYDESNCSSLNLEEAQIPLSEEADTLKDAVKEDIPESGIRFDIGLTDDDAAAKSMFSSSPTTIPKSTVRRKYSYSMSDADSMPSPPKPCNINWNLHTKTYPNLYRSFSMPRQRLGRDLYSTCITDSERSARQMERWKNELNLTLPRDFDPFYVRPDSELQARSTEEFDSYSNSTQHSYSDYDLYDLNFLLFPLNNLSVDKKEEVFDWIMVYNKSSADKPLDNMERNIDLECQSSTDNCSNDSQPVKRRHKKSYRKHRKSLSSTALNDTTNSLDNRRNTEFYSYWSATNICRTLDKIMTNKPPLPDTLGLSRPVRKELCLRLYTMPINSAQYSWETLAGVIGLEEDSVNLIELYIHNHSTKYSAADIVLRHWQFMHNKGKCAEPCTKENLLHILKHKLERNDLVELLLEDKIQNNILSDTRGQQEGQEETRNKEILGETVGRMERISTDSTMVKQKLEEDGVLSETCVKQPLKTAVQNTCYTSPVSKNVNGEVVSQGTTTETCLKQRLHVAVQNTCFTTPVAVDCVGKDLQSIFGSIDIKNIEKEAVENTCFTSPVKENGSYVTNEMIDTSCTSQVKDTLKDNESVESRGIVKLVTSDSSSSMQIRGDSVEKTCNSTSETMLKGYRVSQEVKSIKHNEGRDTEMNSAEKDRFRGLKENQVDLNDEKVRMSSGINMDTVGSVAGNQSEKRNVESHESLTFIKEAVSDVKMDAENTSVDTKDILKSDDSKGVSEQENNNTHVLKSSKGQRTRVVRSSSQTEEFCKRVAHSIKSHSGSTELRTLVKPLVKPKPFVLKIKGNSNTVGIFKRSDV